ncbi:VPLPA-CTERM sorting domain-containing protein [uncultured Desulfosarcina sp.]|uniref:VPLPA-CTERM sorting domain-containing protein n=1 Tax=uncultured Desulfosarcina sp. TaxID=218289 RepID=UPI0029C91AAB|nr:VPLPA-CTERM sorting domain-containing protein [uncultured Desulfosarcina sp.]
MKKFVVLLLAMGFIIATAGMAGASIYASSIVEGTTLHNWDGTCHGDLDVSVILGAPTNALDGTGYTGWGSGESGWITLGFDATLNDGEGDDLIVYGFGPGSGTELLVSSDNINWTSLGALGSSSPGTADVWGYDFSDFGVTSADYVKIIAGPAKFIDAVEGVYAVPVPAAVWLLGSGLIGMVGIRKRSH